MINILCSVEFDEIEHNSFYVKNRKRILVIKFLIKEKFLLKYFENCIPSIEFQEEDISKCDIKVTSKVIDNIL